MLKLIIGILFLSFFSNVAFSEQYLLNTSPPTGLTKNYHAQPINCGIMFGGSGADSPWIKVKNDRVTKVNNIGGPWSFIRKTYGPCSFMIYNKNNFDGRHVNYGSDIRFRIRVASVATADKGGWKARSVIITPHKKPACQVTLYGTRKGMKGLSSTMTNIHQTFYGPSRISDITGWSLVSKTSGNSNCSYTLYNENKLSGRNTTLGKVNNILRVGWRIRSLEINQ